MIFALAITTSVILLMALALPFVKGAGGNLADASSIDSPERLAALKATLVQRMAEEEAAAKSGLIGERAWQQRRQFLTNRFIDAARRLDYVQAMEAANQGEKA